MAIDFPNVNPVVFSLGDSPFKITWYSISYVVGIILSWYYISFLNKKEISKKQLDDLITYVIIGIIVGGRLGYVFFYDFKYYLHDPINILKTWQGGMSFHGGLIGVITAIFIFSKNNGISFFKITDLAACATPIGLFFGRIANFINAELWGRKTNVAWGVVFPGEDFARHPSQIYEALSEGMLSFIILYLLYTKTSLKKYNGMLSGIFLLLYASFRLFFENYREPDEQLGFIFLKITMGQILSLPMFVCGIIIIIYSYKQKNVH